MTPIEIIINKLRKLDDAAADYVMFRHNEGTLNPVTKDMNVGSFFTWSLTPQGHEYWRALHYKYTELPNTTPLGNSL